MSCSGIRAAAIWPSVPPWNWSAGESWSATSSCWTCPRFLAAFQFPAGEVQRLAAEFAGAEGVQAYLRSPVLKDKLIRMIERYYETLSIAPDKAIIDANIHVVTSEGSDDEYREDGRLICSKSAWASATRGTFRTYRGSGDHGHMLHRPHLEFNAALLSGILPAHLIRNRFSTPSELTP